MKNSKGVLLSLVAFTLLLSGCKTTKDSSSNSSTSSTTSSSSSINLSTFESTTSTTSSTSSSSTSSSSDTSKVDPYEEALINTKYYNLVSSTSSKIYEIHQEDFYYSAPYFTGYFIPEEEGEYYHSFDIVNKMREDGTYFDTMEVYGRSFRKEDVGNYLTFKMYDILYYCSSSFKQSTASKYTYVSSVKDLGPIFEEYFQSKIMGSCNYFEIDITEDYRFKQIRFYEKTTLIGDAYLNQSLDFQAPDKNSAAFYLNWLEEGKQINTRVRDIKILVPKLSNPNIPVSLYENDEVTIDVIVSAIDVNNDFYVTQNDANAGPVGLKVEYGYDIKDLEVGDHITITGTIKTESRTNIYTYLYNITYVKKDVKESFAPAYEEDYMVDIYGGGTYAGVVFNNNLVYGGSLYNTFAYVLDIPSNIDYTKDIVVTLICPNIVDLGGKYFVLDLVIPAKLDQTLKTSMVNTIEEAGIYSSSKEVFEAKELSLEKFVVNYNFSSNLSHKSNRGTYPVSLVATNDSFVSNKLSLKEKMESYFSLVDFPVLSDDNASYKFGSTSGLFIESVYGDYNTKDKTGLFISYSSVTESKFNQYQQTIINYGFEKFDEIKDISRERHYIFTLGDVVLDFSLSLDDYTLLCWVYLKPMIMCKSIEDQLNAAIGSWFNVDKYFARLSGTTDADYTLFSLKSYAGKDYTNSPLTVLALDLKTNRYQEYLTELVQNLGYKQYRNPQTNRPASYKIRGVNHQLIYQDKKNISIDIAVYETRDYTYTGHSKWNYRIELVFLNDSQPMEIDTYNNLDKLTDIVKKDNPIAYFNPTLPSDAVVEYWLEEGASVLDRDVYYGYGSRNEAYIYTSSVDECYNAIVDSLVEAGYILWGSTSNVYVIYDGDNSYHVTLLKDNTRGFVRVIQGTGGVDFWQQS